MQVHLPHIPRVIPWSRTAADHKAGRDPSATRRWVGLILGVVAFAAMVMADAPEGMPVAAWRTAAVGLLMAVWWVMEAIPVAATALVPLALFPMLGVASVKEASAPFANPLIYLFLGGFMIALAMERWNLHRRLALGILKMAGFRPGAMIAGFMGATAGLSMWVSNTATATMMLPIGLSVITLLSGEAEDDGKLRPPDNFGIALLLGIAYGASIGGMGTIIGTPPNAVLAGLFVENYGIQIGFGEWMLIGMPFALVMLIVTWFVLVKVMFPPDQGHIAEAEGILVEQMNNLGPMSRGEKLVLLVLVTTGLLWIFRPMIDKALPGLNVNDAGIAILAAISLFAIPVEPTKSIYLLDWRQTQKLPWGVLILVGGGLSLGNAVNSSGLSDWIAGILAGASSMPTVALVAGVALAVIVVSHFTSNTATAAAFLPVIASLAASIGENPLLLTVAGALAASCAFMLPVSTPPNAIVFASGMITVPQMVKAGAVINIIALGLIVAAVYLLVIPVFGVELGVMPEWARP